MSNSDPSDTSSYFDLIDQVEKYKRSVKRLTHQIGTIRSISRELRALPYVNPDMLTSLGDVEFWLATELVDAERNLEFYGASLDYYETVVATGD